MAASEKRKHFDVVKCAFRTNLNAGSGFAISGHMLETFQALHMSSVADVQMLALHASMRFVSDH